MAYHGQMTPKLLIPLLAALCHAPHPRKSAYCGVRGGLEYSIGLDKRRPIRYRDRLKASRQYRKAIEDLHATEPQTAP